MNNQTRQQPVDSPHNEWYSEMVANDYYSEQSFEERRLKGLDWRENWLVKRLLRLKKHQQK